MVTVVLQDFQDKSNGNPGVREVLEIGVFLLVTPMT
jgi:hypothetical protein